jgi:tight adherence protein C
MVDRRRTIAATAVTLVLAVLARPLAVLVPIAIWGAPRWRAARDARAQAALVAAEVPEVVDLLRLAVGAGLTVSLAVAAVGRHGRGSVAQGLADAAAATRRGRRLADALDDLPEQVGEPVRALASTLAGCERYGHAIGPALERLAADCRDDQRRQAEAAARRVPVLLLFPLVLCVLPAFALLTVAPLVAGALRALHL